MPTSVVRLIDLSQKVDETERNNVKLMNKRNDLVTELDKSLASRPLARNSTERAVVRVKAFKKHVETSNSGCTKTVEDAAQVVM